MDGGERPFGDAGKFPPSVEAVWTRIRAKEWKAGATSARPHECGAVDDAKPRNRAHIWPLASTPDQNGAHKRCHGRKRCLFGAPAVPDAADTVPTASAIIDMPGNESDGVRLAISGAPDRTSARVTRPKSPNGPMAGAPEPLQPPKSPGEPPQAPARVECRGSLARSASKSSRTCCGGPSCLKSPIRQFSFTGTLSGQAALKRPQKADPRAWGRVARVRGVPGDRGARKGSRLTFCC